MPELDIFMLGFIALVAVIGVGWFVYETRKDNEK